MSPSHAESCGITQLIDKKWRTEVSGVGHIKFKAIGKIHLVETRIGSHVEYMGFDVVEGERYLTIGIEMLRMNQACLDFRKNVLIIRGEEVPFLGQVDISNPTG